MNQPLQTFDGKDLYPTLFDKAACLWAGIIRNHPFVQANKRTGTLAMLTFLRLNGRKILARVEDFVEFTLSIARDKNITIEEIANWLRRRSRRID